jgi:pimeloyl-ACP methyl ester carboxylesterase
MAALPRRLEVRTLPGYGVPAARHADLRPRTLATDLLTELPDNEDAPVLVGHSASCQVVAHAAALNPDRVRGLLLVGPTTDPRSRSWLRLAARWLATAKREKPGQVPSLVRQYHRTTLLSMARAMDQARDDRIDATLARVHCPVLVVRGRHDRICPADWAEALAETVTLPRGGHMVPRTHGELLAPVLGDFAADPRPR